MPLENRVIFGRDTLLIAIFSFCCLLIELPLLHPYDRPIPMQVVTLSNGTSVVLKELSLDNPYIPSHQQICPTALLVALCMLVPLGVLGAVTYWAPKPGEAASFLRGFMLTVACNVFLTDLIKNYIGYLRPYVYGECGFDPVTRACTLPAGTAQAHKSFPSGHASLSFSSMLFTSLFLLRKVAAQPMKMKTCLGVQDCTNVALLLALSPVMLAFWIASSRVRENDHHPADICFGSFIGSAWAIFWYVRYFCATWKCAEMSIAPSSEDTHRDDEADSIMIP
ncbi:plpp5 [Symbiodinium sp. CCMP2592]|nr:plpp5 [Symbiodinium sp. CCMP2592]